MQARMKNPAFVLPDAIKGIGTMFKAINQGGISHELQEIVGLRTSQINGCGACVHAHTQNLIKADQSVERIAAIAAWRHAPFFTDAERAALKLAEAMTRQADLSTEPVSDELWDEVADHYDEQQLSALILVIAVTNLFNRINATIQEPVGTTWG
ncbi:alkylhydroperoxidase AhpD family core domain-containing protein [Actinokineospora alba]|uniref:Alkylhydroperoxidase AhpD family core domain-containing protein n=1 Tax=Actinokineospora alba TaxID=504798 RepID=A0A1H0LUC4_9PSEU|nr:carboxymuconolactone decarboxylase family protein [Actinokineospora alba]TDP67461.1 AhpD family alkylhydroperoxidase [Actinokineospora alba]SDI95926.1 alkylhydroperoxidase AhpD family core domain-containing protein [Actinokineospora alba]SDO71798.1 alkylhydroperoxidase AhpD family core domain-containing protein [Actinokineospora alba]